ncbi:hypothetical protein [Actinocrispum sp. NPDC049592]|uniref:hypothetical protein n=1 Tax=Actinocrispum sp. NPDC049592 TaxID=3154835 RepID=UPI00344A6AAF
MKRVLIALGAAMLVPLVPLTATAADVPDPLAPGSHQVSETGYTLGDTAFQPPNFPGPVELTGQAYYPTDVDNGPYPTVVLLHGRHATCVIDGQPYPSGDWPCPSNGKPIPSYLGYGELARNLASHGYSVISVSANGINSADAMDPSYGQPARGELVLKHLDLLKQWSQQADGALPQNVAKAYDLTKVGVMGHSRGGEGVVNAVDLNSQREQRYGIKALLPLAATDFERRIPTGVAMAAVEPTCDGDVSDLQGVHYYDDGRYRIATDHAVRHVITVFGANHNYFNSVWSDSSGLPGSGDDWGYTNAPNSPCSPGTPTRLTEQQQRAVGTAYMGAFFRYALGGESAFAPLFNGSESVGALGKVLVSYSPPSASGRRLDVNRFASWRLAGPNDLGGQTTTSGKLTSKSCGGGTDAYGSCLRWGQASSLREPHRGFGFGGVQAQSVSWTATDAVLANAIPEQRGDVHGYKAIQFRAAVDYTSELNKPGAVQDLHVTVTDASGHTASAPAGQFGKGLEYPPTNAADDVVPHLLLNQIRIPLNAFTGVDLTQIRSVGLAFDATPSGTLTLADLSFTD